MKKLAECMEEIRRMHAQPTDSEADKKKIEELTRRIAELEEALKREQQQLEEEKAKMQSSAEEQAGRLKQAQEENEGLKVSVHIPFMRLKIPCARRYCLHFFQTKRTFWRHQ